jgi:hypothetical protein
MSNHSSDIAHSTLNRVLIACRDEAIALVAGVITLGSSKLSSRSLRQPLRKAMLRVQHGTGRPRAPSLVELESAETAAQRADLSEKLALQVWSDDGGHTSECNDGPSSDFVAPLDWRRRRGGFRRIALLASGE